MKKTALILTAVLVLSAFFAGCSKEVVVIESAKDLEGKKIGVQAGTTGEIYVQENVPGAKVYSFKSGIDAALDLKNGSIDAVVLDELPAKERHTSGRNQQLPIHATLYAATGKT